MFTCTSKLYRESQEVLLLQYNLMIICVTSKIKPSTQTNTSVELKSKQAMLTSNKLTVWLQNNYYMKQNSQKKPLKLHKFSKLG